MPVRGAHARGQATVEERTYVFDGGSTIPALAHGGTRRVGGDVGVALVPLREHDPLGTPERLLDERGDMAGSCGYRPPGARRIEGSGEGA